MEAETITPSSGELTTMDDSMQNSQPSSLNGEINGTSPDEDEEESTPVKKDANTSLKAVNESPIVIELNSDVDSPLKVINNVKRKLDTQSNTSDNEEQRNGEINNDDTTSSIENESNNKEDENGDVSDENMEEADSDKVLLEENKKMDQSSDIEEVNNDDIEDISEDPLGNDSDNKNDIQEISEDPLENDSDNKNDIQEISDDPLENDSDNKNGDKEEEDVEMNESSEKTPPSTPNDKQKIQDARRKSVEARRQALLNVTPRRSGRNISKNKKYIDGMPEDLDIEEILPEDPLAVTPLKKSSENDTASPSPNKNVVDKKLRKKNPIIISDTKALAQLAANKKKGKKEPTLVIIDTDSILSGRGPVPVSTPVSSPLPVLLPAQGIYPLMHPHTIHQPPKPQPPPAPAKPKGPIGLTDDMYVVEAPSFIVPYVYEKPPIEPLKEVVEKMTKQLREQEKKEREEKKKRKEKEREEKAKRASEKKEKEEEEVKEEKEGEEPMEVDQDTPKKKSEEDDEEPKADHDSDYKDSEGEEYDSESDSSTSSKTPSLKPKSYFESSLGKFFMQIGVNLVQEHVQTDLLRMQKRKLQKGGTSNNPETQLAVQSLLKNLEQSKENNKPYKFDKQKCKFCNFKTESSTVLQHHLEIPHLKNFLYHCNFCPVALRTNHDILFHMKSEHNINGRMDEIPAFHQCPNCQFEDNQKSKLTRHLLSCMKKFRPEKNSEPPLVWEPPAKIPRMSNKNSYRPVMPGSPSNLQYLSQRPILPKMPAAGYMPSLVQGQVKGRPSNVTSRFLPDLVRAMPRAMTPSQLSRAGMMYNSQHNSRNLVPSSYQISGDQIYQRWSQQGGGSTTMTAAMPRLTHKPQGGSTSVSLLSGSSSNSITIQSTSGMASAAKLMKQPSISITPVPRQSSGPSSSPGFSHTASKPTRSQGGKDSFVICEICDGYIKDLEQLRNHMQWIHKVKIHPKMIYNRPPLNCQKCQFRFFTDQGLERHLLGSHGLVTSSMQEASNKGKDGGRCPVCGRVYQWKLLNHVARDHNMTLKPAHLSYKCTVCTATFGMYKQFENHVYSAHSVAAKKGVVDKKVASNASSSSSSRGFSTAELLLNPLKINNEITIIPQRAKSSSGSARRTN